MAHAFSNFDEPHAWLIRGLVEYGWVDCSRAGGHLPPGKFGGINFSRFADDDGRSGLALEVPAAAAGRVCAEDAAYQFDVQVTRSNGALVFTVRCPMANYFQEFPYNGANPLWAAGYIHQALTEYVPQFVEWRLAGGEVTWAQRAGIPEIEGEPASFMLVNFVRERVTTNRPLHLGPAEGWWAPGTAVSAAGGGAAGGGAAWSGPVAVAGKGAIDPVYVTNAAGVAGVAGMADAQNVQARALTQGPGTALLVVSGLAMVEGLLLMLNALSVILWYRDDLLALGVSLVWAFGMMIGSFASVLGALQYRKAKGGLLPWVSMLWVAMAPLCCIGGFPVAVWALLTWNKPMVKGAR